MQIDTALWTYRNQVLHTPHLLPRALFWSVKRTEALFHLRPAGLLRLVRGGDARIRKILRASMLAGLRVVLAEIMEFALATRFSRSGTLRALPGMPTTPTAEAAHLPALLARPSEEKLPTLREVSDVATDRTVPRMKIGA